MNTSIVSIGQAAALIQRMPAQIQQAAKELNIQPTMKINMIDHYAESDLQAISEFLQKQQRGRVDTSFDFLRAMR